MKLLRLLFLLVTILFSESCKKKKYPENIVEGQPEFYMKATVGNTEHYFQAGINNYAMFSSYTQDSLGLYTFVGELKPTNCNSNCPKSMKIHITDFKLSEINQPGDMTIALQPKNYPFLMLPRTVAFTPVYNKQAASYSWDFGDGQTSSAPNPEHTYKQRGTYLVKLTITSVNNCVSSITSLLKIGNTSGAEAAEISVTSATGNNVSFKSKALGGKAPLSYYWSFGDGFHSVLSDPTHAYKVGGSYPVSLRIIDANNDTTYSNYNCVTQNDFSSCAANFSKTISVINPQTSVPSFSQIYINWTDESGNIYRSSTTPQSPESFFNIASVENFDDNENNQATKKIKLRFGCNLQDNNNKAITIKNAEAVICVAYKK